MVNDGDLYTFDKNWTVPKFLFTVSEDNVLWISLKLLHFYTLHGILTVSYVTKVSSSSSKTLFSSPCRNKNTIVPANWLRNCSLILPLSNPVLDFVFVSPLVCICMVLTPFSRPGAFSPPLYVHPSYNTYSYLPELTVRLVKVTNRHLWVTVRKNLSFYCFSYTVLEWYRCHTTHVTSLPYKSHQICSQRSRVLCSILPLSIHNVLLSSPPHYFIQWFCI